MFLVLMRMIKHYSSIFPDIDTKNLPQYFPIQFEPSSKKMAYLFWSDKSNLDGEVGEFLYNIVLIESIYSLKHQLEFSGFGIARNINEILNG